MSYSPLNAIAHPPFDAVASLRKHVILRDDFLAGTTATGLVGDLGWTITSVAGAADSDVHVISTAAVVQGHPGVIHLNSGPTTPAIDDEGSLFLVNADGLILPDGDEQAIYVAAIVRFPAIVDVEFNFGLFDAANAAGRGVNSVSVEYDESADAEFNLVCVDGSAALAVATDVVVAVDTWYLLEILAHEHECQLFIDGEYKARCVTAANIPDDEGLAPGFKIATEATAECGVYIDAFMLRVPVSR